MSWSTDSEAVVNIEINDKAARARFVVDVKDVVLARHLPLGDGTLTFLSPASSRVICIPSRSRTSWPPCSRGRRRST
ncbi:MAG: hypothetical protein M3276_00380 [Actinomycetota bacterium]|nr:hypothetical protein [Actinomycetota bacterium]